MKNKGYGSSSPSERMTPEDIKKRNLENYGSKIKNFRIRANYSVDRLAESLGISKSSVRNWECGLTRPDPELLYRMFIILDVEPNEFFDIKGVGSLLTNQEKRLINSYRKLDPRSRCDLEIFAETLSVRSYIRTLRKVYKNISGVPYYGRTAAAGSCGTDWPECPEEEIVLLLNEPAVEAADEIITVSGESMEPRFHNNDRVLVEYCSEIQNGDIGIFFVPGIGGVIKEKTYDRLHSLNPEYDDIFPHEEGARLIGRVLAKIDDSMIPDIAQQKLYFEADEERKKDPAVFDTYD